MEKLRFPRKPLLQRLKLIIKLRSAQMTSFSTKLILFILIFLFDINLVLSKEYASEIFFKIRTETNSEAKSIGSYSKGCLAGAEYLPNHSLHYEALKPSRNRFWGHPNLISYIKNTSKEVYGGEKNDVIELKKKYRNSNIFFSEYIPYIKIEKKLNKIDICILPYTKKITVSTISPSILFSLI